MSWKVPLCILLSSCGKDLLSITNAIFNVPLEISSNTQINNLSDYTKLSDIGIEQARVKMKR